MKVGLTRTLTVLQSLFADDFEETLVERGWAGIFVLDLNISQLLANREFNGSPGDIRT
jgi:hypothetical protein